MTTLPDPRSYGPGADDNHLLRRVTDSLSATDAELSGALAQGLREALRALLEAGADAEIERALRFAPSAATYSCLWQALCDVADRPPTGPDTVVTRVFALPCVIVCGARARTVIPGVLPNVNELVAVLERHGALGPSRNVGVSNALCGTEFLEAIKPSTVYGWARAVTSEGVPREIVPQDIVINPGPEQAHVRFLVGAGIASAHAPSVVETAANIGAWGMALTRVLAQQLAQPGLDMLPVPRPPAAILKAAHLGRCAQLELAFNLFVSNTVRRFRSAVGDPTVVISSHRNAAGGPEIRISLSTALDDTLLEGFRWPLHPLDEFDRIVAGISGLLRECRINDVQMVSQVVPENSEVRRGLFLAARDLDVIENALKRH